MKLRSRRRRYVMRARADSAAATRKRIVAAAIALYYERPGPGSTLDDIARRAGVTVQTVLRRFGSRAALDDAARAEAIAQVEDERRAEPGDVRGAARALIDHYERRGRVVLAMLAQETLDGAPDLTDGRALHRRWVADSFAPQLARRAPRRRDALVDQLVIATDVYAWKLLRVDRGLSRASTQDRIESLIAAVVSRKEA
jgi:AcrR family transcriptional regulator